MDTWSYSAIAAAAYLLGGVSPGYWLVRWRTGSDVRAHGSGATGATNVGRVLGRGGFAIVLLADAAKGAAIVAAAQWAGASPIWTQAVILAAIAGHIWPVQLGFHGGKGVALFLGAWLMLQPEALVPSAVVTLLALPAVRRFSLAGLCGLAVMPLASWWFLREPPVVALSSITTTLIIFAHREHLRRWLHPDTAATQSLS